MNPLIKSALITLTLCAATAAFGQTTPDQAPPQAPPPMAHTQPNPAHQTKELAKKLGLTPDQTSQIEPILADRDQREQALMSNTTLDPKSLRQQRRAIMMDSEQKLNAILTPAQQQQFAALRQQRRNHGAPLAGTAPPPSIS
jgi:Spy/CpxP family protein refolding chaperone